MGDLQFSSFSNQNAFAEPRSTLKIVSTLLDAIQKHARSSERLSSVGCI
jgi:hypothetical protein